MDSLEKIAQYVEEFPEEVRLVVKSLDSSIRQAILVLLNTKVELSFSEIQKALEIDKVKLNNHLKNLFSSALIDHYYRHEVGNPNYSYYSLSRLGRRVLSHLVQAFIPPSPIQEVIQLQSFFEEYMRAHDNSWNPSGKPFDLTIGEIDYGITIAYNRTKTETLEPPSNNFGRYQRVEEWVR